MISVICARSGSKRIKNKNIVNFFGKPIIYYPIKHEKKNKFINKIYVSTNSPKIKKISEKYGASVPYLRSKKLSNDEATLKEVLKNFCDNVKFEEKYVCCIYSTAVLLENKVINSAFLKIKKLDYDLIIGVKEFESDPEFALEIKGNKLDFVNKSSYLNQKKIIKKYSDAGSFFIFNKENYSKTNYIPKKTTFIKLKNHMAVDVNDKKDLKLLEVLYKK